MASQLLRRSLGRVVRQRVRGAPAGNSLPGVPTSGKLSAEMNAYVRTEHQLFNKPAAERTSEYWETSYYLYAASLAFAGIAYAYVPNTDITDWARDEAEERAARRAAGLPVEYGVNYASLKYENQWTQAPGALPTLGSSDEDDDE